MTGWNHRGTRVGIPSPGYSERSVAMAKVLAP